MDGLDPLLAKFYDLNAVNILNLEFALVSHPTGYLVFHCMSHLCDRI